MKINKRVQMELKDSELLKVATFNSSPTSEVKRSIVEEDSLLYNIGNSLEESYKNYVIFLNQIIFNTEIIYLQVMILDFKLKEGGVVGLKHLEVIVKEYVGCRIKIKDITNDVWNIDYEIINELAIASILKIIRCLEYPLHNMEVILNQISYGIPGKVVNEFVNKDKSMNLEEVVDKDVLVVNGAKVTDLVDLYGNITTESVTIKIDKKDDIEGLDALASTSTSTSGIDLFNLFELIKLKGNNDEELEIIQIKEPITVKGLKLLLKDIDLCLNNLSSLKSRGFVNKKVIPLLDDFIKYMKLDQLVDIEGKPYTLGYYTIQFYNWVYNLLMVNFYYVTLKGLKIYTEDDDYRVDLLNYSNHIYTMLHPLIRNKLQKPGISVTLSTVVGFDTEFELKNAKKNLNSLLSVQIALNTRVIIRIPHVTPFVIASIHTITSEIYSVESKRSYDKLDLNIRYVIDNIRLMEYSPYTKYIEIVKNKLDSIGVKRFDLLEKHSIYYVYPESINKECILYKDSYSFKELVDEIDIMSKPLILDNIKSVSSVLLMDKLLDEKHHEKILTQCMTRFTKREGDCLTTITFNKKTYVCCHLTNADISILDDFEELKHKLDIVHKNFITLSRPLKYGVSNVYIRDTSLLAPAGKKSLDAVGGIYGNEYKKVDIPWEYKSNMRTLMEKDKPLFEKYALKDAEITLKHATEMENFNNTVNRVGVPITLSSISKQYVLEKWKIDNYSYQNTPGYLLGDTPNLITPKGLNKSKEAGLFISHFISNYRGGRNESFMYGYEKETQWYDYDLTSAYTTSMSYLGHPNLGDVKIIKSEIDLKDIDLLTNYVILNVDFSFPVSVKYPSIPCYVDETTTVYPLSGSNTMTGIEYLLAKRQGCEVTIKYGVCLPFELKTNPLTGELLVDPVTGKNVIIKPFFEIIKELQIERKKYPKGSLKNLLYKEIGNSIYGNVVRGISNKRLFDIKTGDMKTLTANELSNPILGSYITALVRTVIAETLDNIHYLGGRVVSVTTDGFITDLENLEEKLLTLPNERIQFLKLYKDLRKVLGFEAVAYEEKHKGKGIISWCTRGQLGIESYIKATTGFQSQGFSKEFLVSEFIEAMNSKEKHLEFIQKSLRGGNEIYKKGGHVTMVYKERKFNLLYDNRRRIKVLDDEDEEKSFELGEMLLDSEPLTDIKEGEELRGVSKMLGARHYNKNTNGKSESKTYKSMLDSAVRTFLKGLLAEKPLFGLEKHRVDFKSYKDIIDFIRGYEKAKGVSLSKSSLSHLRNRKMILKTLDRSKEVEDFVVYLKSKLKYFNDEDFFKK